MTPERLEELKARAMHATAGPWQAQPYDIAEGGCGIIAIRTDVPVGGTPTRGLVTWSSALAGATYNNVDETEANAAHIAACDPQTILELIADIEAKDRALSDARDWIKYASADIYGDLSSGGVSRELVLSGPLSTNQPTGAA